MSHCANTQTVQGSCLSSGPSQGLAQGQFTLPKPALQEPLEQILIEVMEEGSLSSSLHSLRFQALGTGHCSSDPGVMKSGLLLPASRSGERLQGQECSLDITYTSREVSIQEKLRVEQTVATLQVKLEGPRSFTPKIMAFNAIVKLMKKTFPTKVLVSTDSPPKRGRGEYSLSPTQNQQHSYRGTKTLSVRSFFMILVTLNTWMTCNKRS